MGNNKILFLLSVISLILFSCKKEEFHPSWKEHPTSVSSNLNSIYFTDDSTGHIVGGNFWFADIFLTTTDAGKTWQADSLMRKEIYALSFNAAQNGFAVGLGGDFYFKNSPADNWQLKNLLFPNEAFRDVRFWEKEKGIIITGGAFQYGKIIQVNFNNNDFTASIVDSFEQELSAVFYSDENTIHAVGYGIVVRSIDGGNTWKKKNIIGDFFRAIHFPTERVGFAIGYSGSIIKTTDAGENWKFIRNGDNLTTSNEAFRSVFFINENEGYIVGDQGLFWKTENGGDDWQEMPDLPEVDLHDIFIQNNIGFIVGKEGRIFSFEL